MTISKDFRFPVSISFEHDGLASASAPDADPIAVAVPPEFRGPGGRWSSEQLLVASVGSCYAVTLAAVAERRGIPIHSLTVTGTGTWDIETTAEWASSQSSSRPGSRRTRRSSASWSERLARSPLRVWSPRLSPRPSR